MRNHNVVSSDRSLRLIDVVSAGTGDLHRARKDSFYYYQKVIKSNGEDVE